MCNTKFMFNIVEVFVLIALIDRLSKSTVIWVIYFPILLYNLTLVTILLLFSIDIAEQGMYTWVGATGADRKGHRRRKKGGSNGSDRFPIFFAHALLSIGDVIYIAFNNLSWCFHYNSITLFSSLYKKIIHY